MTKRNKTRQRVFNFLIVFIMEGKAFVFLPAVQ